MSRSSISSLLRFAHKPQPSTSFSLSRGFSTSCFVPNKADILPALRHLLRHTAQPVSVITANLSYPASAIHRHDHGATLSSFSSISFNPPLVAFSLRLPSRLANAFLQQGTPSRARFHVHLLEHGQEDLARLFARQVQKGDHFPVHTFEQLEAGALGTLECELAHTVHLDELSKERPLTGQQSEVKSCLFVAQVLDVRPGHKVKGRPLVWHDQQYRPV